jgi:hypothetical protein
MLNAWQSPEPATNTRGERSDDVNPTVSGQHCLAMPFADFFLTGMIGEAEAAGARPNGNVGAASGDPRSDRPGRLPRNAPCPWPAPVRSEKRPDGAPARFFADFRWTYSRKPP